MKHISQLTSTIKAVAVLAMGLVGVVLPAAPAGAQPAMVGVGMGASDLTADGQTAVGSIFDYSTSIANNNTTNWIFKYIRGVGGVNTNALVANSGVLCSADASVLACDYYNLEQLNNASNSITYSNPDFAMRTTTAHYWTSGTGLVNIGPAPTGWRCDFTINDSNALSRDGRYVFTPGWSDQLCGPYRIWRFDRTNGSFTMLPVSFFAPARKTGIANTWACSSDGNVCGGYDQNYDPAGSNIARHAAAWRFNGSSWTEYVLDPWGGEIFAVSGDGKVVVGYMSTTTMLATFGTDVRSPVAWKWVNNTWVPSNLGGTLGYPDVFATSVSYDGSTIVGEQFIWRADINGGVAMDLTSYLISIGWTFSPDILIGSPSGAAVKKISEDGSAILVAFIDHRNPCLSTFDNGIIYLNGTTCEPPTISFQPQSQPDITGPPTVYGIVTNIFANGSWPLNYQWQKEVAVGVWQDLVDDNCDMFNAANFDVKDPIGYQLRLGTLSGTWPGVYRCKVSNACGSVTSAEVTIGQPVIPVSCRPNLMTASGCLGPVDLLQFLNLYFVNYDGHGSAVPGDNQTFPDLNPTSPIYAVPCTPSADGEYPVIPAVGLKADYDGDCQVGPTDLLGYLHDYFNPPAECFGGCFAKPSESAPILPKERPQAVGGRTSGAKLERAATRR